MDILIIDDDEFFRKFYSTKLQETGYSVDVAGDGEEGLQKIQNSKPDLILLDIIMPKKNGFEVLQELAKQNNNTPVMIFSTLEQQKDIDEAKKLGAVDYINKGTESLDSTLAKISSHMPH